MDFPFTTFRHVRCHETGAVVTAVVQVYTDRVEVSFAFCAPSDQFCRKTGRQIAVDRRVSGDYVVVQRADEIPSITDCVFRALEKYNKYTGTERNKPLWLNEFVRELVMTRKEYYKTIRHMILKGHRLSELEEE